MKEPTRIEAQVEELKRQLESFEQRLAVLEAAKPKPAPLPPGGRPWVERVASITAPPPPPPTNMATDDELRQLLVLVGERFPVLAPKASLTAEQNARYFAMFAAGFRWAITNLKRAAPNSEIGYEGWCSEAEQHLRLVGASVGAMAWSPLLAAIIATGDIVYEELHEFPHVKVGLARGTRQHAYDGRHREILAGTRALLKPIERPAQLKGGTMYYQGETSVIHAMRAKGMLDY